MTALHCISSWKPSAGLITSWLLRKLLGAFQAGPELLRPLMEPPRLARMLVMSMRCSCCQLVVPCKRSKGTRRRGIGGVVSYK